MPTARGLHRERPGADAIAPATGAPATAIGDDIWMSAGVSNAYAVCTDVGRVVVNAGLNFEGPLHRQAFDASCPGPTQAIVVTQGHPDHVAGVPALREPATDVIVQANHDVVRRDHEILPAFRARNASFAWGHMAAAIARHLPTLPPELQGITFADPTVVVHEHLELAIGGRRFELFATPGGETIDALVVWLPEDRTLFTGNLFGPLFGHVPNLVTIRGDRYRDPLQYVAAADLVLALRPRRLVTGHFDPIDGDDVIAAEVTALRDATQHVHDQVVAGMEAGLDVHTLMRDVRLPPSLDVGEAYGKTAWNVRAIWEMYAGWFHHRSTTELYDVPASAVAADIVRAAGKDALVRAAARRRAAGEALEAIHLAELVLAAGPHVAARAVALEAHEQLLAEASNFWEAAWLRHAIDRLEGTA